MEPVKKFFVEFGVIIFDKVTLDKKQINLFFEKNLISCQILNSLVAIPDSDRCFKTKFLLDKYKKFLFTPHPYNVLTYNKAFYSHIKVKEESICKSII